MKICINYYGKPDRLNITKEMFDYYIKDEINEFYILYSTWNTKNIDSFKVIFPNAYIKTFDIPSILEVEEYNNNFKMDSTNNHKSIQHYIMGLYIKNKSSETILEYEKNNNIEFDFIITLRCGIYFNKEKISSFYNIILNKNNCVYLAIEPSFNIYNMGSCPDVISISNKNITLKILSQIYNIKNIIINNEFIHPETSFYLYLKFLDLEITQLNFMAFPEKI